MPDENLGAAEAALTTALANVKQAETASASAPVVDYAAIVANWFNAYVANSPASRDVQIVNYLNQTAVPALIAALTKG